MSIPTVSVITPTYNHERFIGSCVESVLRQTVSDWEMFVVDDGSTDNTGAMAARYKDDRVYYLHQNNLGPYRLAETYNHALSRAKGQFVAIIEGDDTWPPEKLARSLQVIEENPELSMVYGRAQRISVDGTVLGLNALPHIPRSQWPNISLRELFLRTASILPVTSLVRRNYLEKIGGFQGYPGFPAVDLPTWLALVQEAPFGFVDEVWGNWRVHASQITSTRLINHPARKLVLSCFDGLPHTERTRLGLTREEILRVHQPFVADEQWANALSACNRADWEIARQFVLGAFWEGGILRKLEAMCVLPMTMVGINPNPVMAKIVRLKGITSSTLRQQ